MALRTGSPVSVGAVGLAPFGSGVLFLSGIIVTGAESFSGRGESDSTRKAQLPGNEEGPNDRKNPESRSGVEEAAFAQRILRDPRERHGAAVYRGIREHRRSRNVQVRLLRAAAVSLGNQIPFRLRMAELLRAR